MWRLSSTARPSPALLAPLSHQNGAYLADCGLGKPAPSATDDALSDALRERAVAVANPLKDFLEDVELVEA